MSGGVVSLDAQAKRKNAGFGGIVSSTTRTLQGEHLTSFEERGGIASIIRWLQQKRDGKNNMAERV